MRWNIVGTMKVLVTRCRAISSRARRASNRSASTTVWPSCSTPMACALGAEWYSGATARCVPAPTSRPKKSRNRSPNQRAWSSGEPPDSGLRMPFGRPVVPELYSSTCPAVRPAGGVPGTPATKSVRARSRSSGVAVSTRSGSRPAVSAAAKATSASRVSVIRYRAPQSPRM